VFSKLYSADPLSLPLTDRRPKRARAEVTTPAVGGKGTPVYLAHSYPTKVPPEAIEPFIAHFTRPGDLVCDPFAGSGMTGVAARRLGRNAVLSDLSPLSVHLATNVTTACDPTALRDAAQEVVSKAAVALDDWYAATCTKCGGGARLNWLVWGETVQCSVCARPVRLWDSGFDPLSGRMSGNGILCPHCGVEFPRRGAHVIESAPVSASVTCLAGCGRMERPALHSDAARTAAIAETSIEDWYPDRAVEPEREMFIRSSLALHGVFRIADFYTSRNLRALARLWAEIQEWPDHRIRQALTFAFTNTAWHGTRMRRYNARGGQRPLTGTLYIPQMSIEVNVADVFRNKVKQLERFFSSEDWTTSGRVETFLASATALEHLPAESADYVFTDPPFGSNIFYADCALIAESWLGRYTDVQNEAVVNRSLSPKSGGKTVADYRVLMTTSFAEIARVLKKGATATVVFQNTNADVWAALEDALADARLGCERANTLDKTQQSHKGYKGRSGAEDVAGFDMVLTVRHRRQAAKRKPGKRGVEDAVSVLSTHLAALPLVGTSVAADRQRTLGYLYAVLLQAHFNGDIGLTERGYGRVRELCASSFTVDDQGRWSVGPAKRTRALTKG
jgi:16S rRNA G966 N2-methylase RsmD